MKMPSIRSIRYSTPKATGRKQEVGPDVKNLGQRFCEGVNTSRSSDKIRFSKRIPLQVLPLCRLPRASHISMSVSLRHISRNPQSLINLIDQNLGCILNCSMAKTDLKSLESKSTDTPSYQRSDFSFPTLDLEVKF